MAMISSIPKCVLSGHCSFSSMAEVTHIFSKRACQCLHQQEDLSAALRHTLALAVELQALNLPSVLHGQIQEFFVFLNFIVG